MLNYLHEICLRRLSLLYYYSDDGDTLDLGDDDDNEDDYDCDYETQDCGGKASIFRMNS